MDSSNVNATNNTVGDPRENWTPRQFYEDYVQQAIATYGPGVIPQLFSQHLPIAYDASGNVAVANPAWFFSVSTSPTPDQQFGSPDALVPGYLDHPSVNPNPGKGNVTNFAFTNPIVARTGNQYQPGQAKLRTDDTIYTPGGFFAGRVGVFTFPTRNVDLARISSAPKKPVKKMAAVRRVFG